jgi:putative DNA primase/helicase
MQTERVDRLRDMSWTIQTEAPPAPIPPAMSPLKPPAPGVDGRYGDDRRHREVDWVWCGVIPRGKLTLLTGESAIGKTVLMLELAAALTRGHHAMHDSPSGRPEDVVYVTGEDDVHDTLCPRLEAAGADLSRVHLVTGVRRTDQGVSELESVSAQAARHQQIATPMGEPEQHRSARFQLDQDLSLIEAEVQRLRQQGQTVPLVVIDSLRYCTGFDVRRSRTSAEETVAELASLAKRWNLAIVVVSADSLTANRRLKPWNTALAETARTVWTITRDPEEAKRRLLLPVKSYLSATPPGWAFAIKDQGLAWEWQPLSINAADFAATAKVSPRNRSRALIAERESAWALNWLAQQLDAGPVCIDTLRKDARDCNVTASMLRQAFFQLNCQVEKEPASGSWYWHLPHPCSHASHDGSSRASRDGLTVNDRSCVEADAEDIPRVRDADIVQDAEQIRCEVPAEVASPGRGGPFSINGQVESGFVGVKFANWPRRQISSMTDEPDDEQQEDERDEETGVAVMELSRCAASGLTPERRSLLRNQRKARRKNQRRNR